jgi:hypothetical protein
VSISQKNHAPRPYERDATKPARAELSITRHKPHENSEVSKFSQNPNIRKTMADSFGLLARLCLRPWWQRPHEKKTTCSECLPPPMTSRQGPAADSLGDHEAGLCGGHRKLVERKWIYRKKSLGRPATEDEVCNLVIESYRIIRAGELVEFSVSCPDWVRWSQNRLF